MTERNAWVIERTDLGVVPVMVYDVLGADKRAPRLKRVVRYDFIPTQFPESQPFTVRLEHDPDATAARVDLDECMALGNAVRTMVWAADRGGMRQGLITAGRTASKPSSAGSSEPPPTA